MSKFERILKGRKEKDGKDIEFKVEKTISNDIIKETTEKIISNIESNNYVYYVGNPKTLVEVVNDNPKYLRSMLNESKSDNIDNLPIYN